MQNKSKKIIHADESSKELIIEVLGSNVTYGFDVDSIYYIKTESKWILIEFLKCDHKEVRPRNSHPKRYWYNWRKFASLWQLKLNLNAELFLVNYEDKQHALSQNRSEREFLIIHVKNMNPTESGGITEEKLYRLNFLKFKEWFLSINEKAGKEV